MKLWPVKIEKHEVVNARLDSVDELLAEIVATGARPWVWLSNDGTWSAAVEVPVPGTGLTAKANIHSRGSAADALRAVREKMHSGDVSS